MITTHAGVFEGIGGFSLAAQRAGLTTKWVCEVNPFRKQILRQNFTHAIQYRNIVHLSSPPTVDLLTGGFPCQNISVAGQSTGQRGIIGPDSRLWYEYFRIIAECKPRYIIIENSAQLRNKGLEIILFDLAAAGYDAQWQFLRACEFGYPHRRERLFIIAYPMQSDGLKLGRIKSFSKYQDHTAKHQDRLIFHCELNGLTGTETVNMYELVMGFPAGWTNERSPQLAML